MSLRIKQLSGEEFILNVISFSTATVRSIKDQICHQHQLNPHSIKLVWRSQELTPDDSSLDTFGISQNDLIHLVHSSPFPSTADSSLLLPQVKKPFHCAWGDCLDRHVKIIGECVYCSGKYCARHRLPESHMCQNMQSCKQQSFNANHSKVMNGKCGGEYAH